MRVRVRVRVRVRMRRRRYRVPRVAPGVTAPKLFPPLLPSQATPGPPLPYRPLQKSRYYYPRFRVGSSICLASSVGNAEGEGGSPFRPWWLRGDRWESAFRPMGVAKGLLLRSWGRGGAGRRGQAGHPGPARHSCVLGVARRSRRPEGALEGIPRGF